MSPAAVVPFILLALSIGMGLMLLREPADRSAGRMSWAIRVGPQHARKQSLLLTALGVLAAPLVLPAGVDTDRLAMVEVPALVLLACNALTWRSADTRLPGLRGFVLRNAAAGVVAMLSWAIAWMI